MSFGVIALDFFLPFFLSILLGHQHSGIYHSHPHILIHDTCPSPRPMTSPASSPTGSFVILFLQTFTSSFPRAAQNRVRRLQQLLYCCRSQVISRCMPRHANAMRKINTLFSWRRWEPALAYGALGADEEAHLSLSELPVDEMLPGGLS